MNDFKYPLGAVPSKPDSRDFVVKLAPTRKATELPKSFMLQNLPPVRNQENEGTCVGHALVGILDYHEIQAKLSRYLSVRDAYEGAREVEPVVGEGAMPRAALKNAQRAGLCHESDWPYVPQVKGTPSWFALQHRPLNKAGAYAQIPLNVLNIKSALVEYGPLLAVVPVTDGFWEPDAEGFVSYAKPVLGYHAVVLVGYDDDQKAYVLRNSWGEEWGNQGYCWLPYTHMITECWTVGANLSAAPAKSNLWLWLKQLFRL